MSIWFTLSSAPLYSLASFMTLWKYARYYCYYYYMYASSTTSTNYQSHAPISAHRRRPSQRLGAFLLSLVFCLNLRQTLGVRQVVDRNRQKHVQQNVYSSVSSMKYIPVTSQTWRSNTVVSHLFMNSVVCVLYCITLLSVFYYCKNCAIVMELDLIENAKRKS